MYLRRRKKKQYWLCPYIQRNINCRLFVAAKGLTEPDEKFQCMYRMTKVMFHELVMVISPAITRQNTNMRECVSAGERILITLRYIKNITYFECTKTLFYIMNTKK